MIRNLMTDSPLLLASGLRGPSRLLALACLAWSSTFCAAAQLQAELITNGGFENPGTAKYTTFAAGNTALTGWTIAAGSVDTVLTTSFWPAAAGSQSLDLNGAAAGTLQQSFATLLGAEYQLQFAYANNPDLANGATTAPALVEVLGTSASPLLSAGISHSGSTKGNMNYTSFSSSFIADANTATLQFSSQLAGYGGMVLDAVSVTLLAGPVLAPESVVPEPSTLGLASLAGLGLVARRRK